MKTPDELADLARQMAVLAEEEGLRELTLEVGKHSLKIRRSRTAARALEPSAEESLVEESEEEAVGVPITSTVVGLLRSAEARPGQRVRKGQVLGLIESVALTHDLACPVDGELVELLAHEGDPVEYGQVLMVIRPEAA